MRIIRKLAQWLCNTKDQQPTADDSLKPESADNLTESSRRAGHVHSQELLTADVTSRSAGVRIIHTVQIVAVKQLVLASPSSRPPFILLLISLSWSWVSCMIRWTLPLPAQSQTVYHYTRLTSSMRAETGLGWLQGDCEHLLSGHLFVGKLRFLSWWYFPGYTSHLRVRMRRLTCRYADLPSEAVHTGVMGRDNRLWCKPLPVFTDHSVEPKGENTCDADRALSEWQRCGGTQTQVWGEMIGRCVGHTSPPPRLPVNSAGVGTQKESHLVCLSPDCLYLTVMNETVGC